MGEAGRKGIGGPWAAFFRRPSAPAAGILRSCSWLRACEMPEGLWVRSEEPLSEELDHVLRSLAPDLRCHVLKDGQLLPEGKRVPRGRIPEGPWRAIGETIVPAPPQRLGPVKVDGKIRLQLVRRGGQREPSAMVTNPSALAAYVETAPAIRLSHLSFALKRDGAALVRRTPLPPIRGIALVEEDGVLLPCGWGWDPPVPAPVVRRVLGLAQSQIALVAEDGSVQTLEQHHFVQMTRAAVRDSVAATT